MLYVGVDAHKRESQLTIMDEKGTILKRTRIASTRDGVQKALGRYRQPLKSVLEACYSWAPMYDWLDEVSEDVVLAHPLKVRAIADARIKTDKIDSETLAHLLRANLIPAAHAPSKDVRAVKRVLRQRMFYVRIRGMLKNRIHILEIIGDSYRLKESLKAKEGGVTSEVKEPKEPKVKKAGKEAMAENPKDKKDTGEN